jgi:uncharacterized protein YjdB
MVDTVVQSDFQSGTIELEFTVPVSSDGEVFLLTLILIGPAEDTVFRGGPLEVTPTVGTAEPSEISVPLDYVGVGSDAAEIQILEAPATLFYGDTVALSAVARDDAGEPIPGVPIVWVSRDTTMAVVADRLRGFVVGTSKTGSVQVEARLLTGQTDVASLSLTQRAEMVTVTPDAATLESLGETVQLTATASDAEGNTIADKVFTWESSDESVATVSDSGLVTAVANGTATITATVDGVSGSATITVAQVAATVEVTPDTATLESIGETVQMTAVASDANGNTIADKTFTWTSSDDSVATVSDSGLVTAVATGSATITATVDGVSGTVLLTVAQVVASVEVTPSENPMLVGQTVQLMASARDANESVVPYVSIQWNSSDQDLARVDGTGLVTAVRPGEATVTAEVDLVAGNATVSIAGLIRGNVWIDNGDGVLSYGTGDEPQAGIEITLTGPRPQSSATTTHYTLEDGQYRVDGPDDGSYTVTCVGCEALGTNGWNQTSADITVAGAAERVVDFYYSNVVRGRIWVDDGDREFSPGGSDIPLSGISVTATGPETSTELTDANGQYRFNGLMEGEYTVACPACGIDAWNQTSAVVTADGSVEVVVDFYSLPEAPAVSDFTYELTGLNTCPFDDGLGNGSEFRLEFQYADANGDVIQGSWVNHDWTFSPSGNYEPWVSNPWSEDWLWLTGDGFSGTVHMNFCFRFSDDDQVVGDVTLQDAWGEISNVLSQTILRPEGALIVSSTPDAERAVGPAAAVGKPRGRD